MAREKTVSFIRSAILWFLVVFCLFKIWPSDRIPGLALLAYAPSPFILIAGVVIMISCLKIHSKAKIAISIFVIFAALFFIVRENPSLFKGSSLTPIPGSTVRILHWNVWNVRKGGLQIANEIKAQNPDVLCLNEAKRRDEKEYPYIVNPFSSHLGGKWNEYSSGNSLILSRLPIQELKMRRWEGIQVLYVRILGKAPFTVLLVDIRSNFLLYRKGVFDSLIKRLDEWNFQPDLILGDFNTPEGSYSLRSTLGKEYSDAYQVVGKGFGYTWPAWIPSMRIDLILTRNPNSVKQHRIGWSTLSDHRWQWIDYQP
jgi:endonuclease/exonuclease/phosphatase family metal-dependent hydrolase